MSNFVAELGLDNVTLFAQDWGGLIGLRVVEQQADRFARIMISNTTLPAMGGIQGWLGYPLFRLAVWREGEVQSLNTDGDDFSFTKWVAYARHTDNFDFQNLFQSATKRELSQASLDGYAAPYPGDEYIAAVRQFPTLVASQLRQNQRVMEEFYKNWDKPLLTAFGTDDVIMQGRDKVWQQAVPGAQGQPHTLIESASHFIQDDKPNEVTELLIDFINRN